MKEVQGNKKRKLWRKWTWEKDEIEKLTLS